MLDEKSKGQEITVAPEALQRPQIIDLMQALKSIEKAKPKQKAAPARPKRKTALSDS